MTKTDKISRSEVFQNMSKISKEIRFNKDLIIATSALKKGTKVKPNDDVIILTISYGKEIKVPDFNHKSSDDPAFLSG